MTPFLKTALVLCALAAPAPVLAHEPPAPGHGLPPVPMLQPDPTSAITMFGEATGTGEICTGHRKMLRRMACDQAAARCRYLQGTPSRARVVKAGVIESRGPVGCYYAKAAVTCRFGPSF